MPTASASHAPKNAAFTAKIRSHMLLAWVYQADMRKYFRNIALISARKTNRFLRFAFRKTVLYPTGYCRTMCGRLLATCFGIAPSLRQKYARKTNRFFRFAYRKTKKWFFTLLLRHNKKDAKASFLLWRRRRDSNPRYGLIHTTPLAGEPLEPLGYFSKAL